MNSRQRTRVARCLGAPSRRRVLAGLFTVILFGYLVLTVADNRRALLQYEWHISPLYLVWSLFSYFLALLLGAFTWHRIVRSMDQEVPCRKSMKFFLQSNLAKRLPGLVWYALERLHLYERAGVAKSVISVALTFELITIIVGGVVVCLSTVWGGATAVRALQQWWLIFPLAGLLVVMAWPVSLYGMVNWVLVHRGHTPIPSQAGRGDLVQWTLFQAGSWLAGGIFIYFLAAGVYPDLRWSHVVPIINSWAGSGLVALVALTVPLGLGLKEVTLAYLLSSFVPWPVAALISLLGRICSIIGDCVGLLIASRL